MKHSTRSRKEENKRVVWLTTVEKLIVKEKPDLAGKINWDYLLFHYNKDFTVQETLTRYLATH